MALFALGLNHATAPVEVQAPAPAAASETAVAEATTAPEAEIDREQLAAAYKTIDEDESYVMAAHTSDKSGARGSKSNHGSGVTSIPGGALQTLPAGGPHEYTGRRISLDFKDAPRSAHRGAQDLRRDSNVTR